MSVDTSRPRNKTTPRAAAYQSSSKSRTYDPDAERQVLGSLILEPALFGKVAKLVDSESFHDPSHALIFEAIEACISADPSADIIDIQALATELRNQDKLDTVGGNQYLGGLTDEATAHVLARAKRVAELATHRSAADASRRAQHAASHGDTATAVEATAEALEYLRGTEQWDPPIPLGQTTLLPWPSDVFGPDLDAIVDGIATEVQTPREMVGMSVLGALSASVMSRFVVHPKPGYSEPVHLYTAIAAESATRKTAIFDATTSPIREHELSEFHRCKDDVAAERATRDALHARLEAAKSEAARAKDGDVAEKMARVDQLAREFEAIPEPVIPRWICDDATPEAIENLLVKHGGKMAIIAPEGGELFSQIAGRYQNGGSTPNAGVFLHGHTGEPHHVDRIGRGEQWIPRTILSITLMTQPSTLQTLASKGLRERGAPARFLYAIPPSIVGTRKSDPPRLSSTARNGYRELIQQLIALPSGQDKDGSSSPHGLSFSSEATAEYHRVWTEIERRMGPDGDLSEMKDWAGKLPGALCRIAGLLHLADQVWGTCEPWTVTVSAETFLRAVGLAEFLISHAKAAFGMMEAPPELIAAKKIAEWLKRVKQPVVTTREIHRGALRNCGKRKDVLDPPLDLLVTHGYLRPVEPKGADKKPGRPAERYRVNPKL